MRLSWKTVRRGLTLLEALLAAVILAMTVSAIVMPFTAGAQGAAQDARATLAVCLAQDMMEEILAQSFHDPDGGEGGESGRATWDDMFDYDGYTEAEGQIASQDGTVSTEPAAARLSRAVSVAGAYVAGQDTGEPPTFLRIDVEISYRGLRLVTLSRLVYDNQ